jgi:arylsulfatase A-like enzyme
MKLIVITIDGLHPGYMGCYGNEWIETPALDRWGADGIVFDQHFADQPDTTGARRAWRNGCYRFSKKAGSELPRDLNEHGVTTVLVTDTRTGADFSAGWKDVTRTAGTEAIIKCAKKAIRQLADQDRWLLWLDLGGLLPPWEFADEAAELYFDPPSEADNAPNDDESSPWHGLLPERVEAGDDALFLRLQRTFAAAVSTVDSHIGILDASLNKLNLAHEATLMVTSGHGLPLGEHTLVGSNLHALHEELVHVPLILRLPDNAHAGLRIGAFTQSVDLSPTIREFFQLPATEMDGRSLIPLLSGTQDSVRPFAVSGWPKPDAMHWAIRTPKRACLVTHPTAGERTARLYIKPDDRCEVNDMAQHFADDVAEMESTLQPFIDMMHRR